MVSEMTYNVSSGTLNPTIPYHLSFSPELHNVYMLSNFVQVTPNSPSRSRLQSDSNGTGESMNTAMDIDFPVLPHHGGLLITCTVIFHYLNLF